MHRLEKSTPPLVLAMLTKRQNFKSCFEKIRWLCTTRYELINKYLVSSYTSYTFANYKLWYTWSIIMLHSLAIWAFIVSELAQNAIHQSDLFLWNNSRQEKTIFFTLLHPTTMRYSNLIAAAIFVIRYGQASHPCSYPSNKLHWQWTWRHNIWRIVNSVPGPNSL